ncbi:hypothetical protein RJT34_25872 [Clitoria ternatea]|uniref:Uncharacterized protein n=1 Tax=Clitoria ternatea TaxID=43366 RepID=A0AAN9FQP0_CLITE
MSLEADEWFDIRLIDFFTLLRIYNSLRLVGSCFLQDSAWANYQSGPPHRSTPLPSILRTSVTLRTLILCCRTAWTSRSRHHCETPDPSRVDVLVPPPRRVRRTPTTSNPSSSFFSVNCFPLTVVVIFEHQRLMFLYRWHPSEGVMKGK